MLDEENERKMIGGVWRGQTATPSRRKESIDSTMPDVSSFDALVDGFQATLIKAATSHVGTSRPGKGRKLWETPKVRYAIRKRNRLHRTGT